MSTRRQPTPPSRRRDGAADCHPTAMRLWRLASLFAESRRGCAARGERHVQPNRVNVQHVWLHRRFVLCLYVPNLYVRPSHVQVPNVHAGSRNASGLNRTTYQFSEACSVCVLACDETWCPRYRAETSAGFPCGGVHPECR